MLHPVRIAGHAVTEDGRVDILMPRFKSKFWSDIYRHSQKGEFISIHLDETGSAMWLAIDGQTNVSAIAEKLKEKFPEKFSSAEDAEKRVTQFCTLLYHQDYISFSEILPLT